METDTISWKQSDDLDDIIYHQFKIPADLQKAELHGLAYRVYEKPQEQSVQCKCCNYYKDHIKFNFCSDLSKSDDHSVANEYFQNVKWMILQLTIFWQYDDPIITSVTFVPFALYFNQQGDECEKHPNCDQNSLKIYSIWNLIAINYSLDDLKYAGVVLSTSIIYIILMKCGSCDIMGAEAFKQMKMSVLVYSGIYIPDKIEDEEILEILDINSDICVRVYRVNLKLYEDLLFEQLKFPYLSDKVSHKERKEYQEKYMGTMKFLTDELQVSQEFKERFMILCEKNSQKYYHKFQIRSPIFQFFIQFLIVFGFSIPSTMAQFLILKLRYDFINNNYSGEEDQMIKKLLNVGSTLVSMIAFSIFNKIGSKILTKLALTIYQIGISLQIALLQNLDLRYWNLFQSVYEQSSQTMLQSEGMLDYVITFSFLNLFVPVITQIFDFNHIWRKVKLFRLKGKKTNNKTQKEANLFFQLRKFNYYERKITVHKIFAVSMLFGFQYPLIIPFSILSLLLIYWVDKCIFINFSIPVIKDRHEELLQGIYYLFNMVAIYYFFFFGLITFKTWIITTLLIINGTLLLWVGLSSLLNQDWNFRTLLSDDDEKYQLFINLKKRLKNFTKKSMKSQVVETTSLLE
ncbi:unnamed protein product (macronuclear) [Paramecium tetraurelia]|uniref:CSC1/OSCA1-like cytosolic domain-containing protein n=1 Tax=Paramecium tetraurelia TaxID=5888 RepID=A0C5U0_PARTE|nr:uncharacterized protein GSPATT00035286001 [Paramecium tetraurelia]CAK66157.1 unnamed protein product [Paramecium tetraurelia]|eukprot:XP_001433554.1 hypothetical protein (macronuclear) [Paramecium tetraurelia strain d4-2]